MDEEKKNSILIIDDEITNLKVLAAILGSEYTIYTATNGASGIEKAKEYLPDLILLDILMPGMNGYEILAEIKKIEDIQKTPVIFITGLDSDEDEEKGLSLDAADYITKPFNNKIVELRVRGQIQIINQMRTIERLSRIDQLTNIPNRRSFDERLQVEWKQAIREQSPISLLMMDIDKFKRINDTYGHQQGDITLQKIANIFPRTFRRPCDIAARWGGEEFAVLLPRTHMEGAMDVAERIRVSIENEAIPCADGSNINVTISIGVNTLVPSRGASVNTFISGADKALYAAKQAGRNNVTHISGPR